ncbi:MAG: hypothetical protein ACRCSR_04455 [Bacteroidales bacterium]
MGYLKIAKELLDGSFWRSLAATEVKMLIELMSFAPYKPVTYNLYGTPVELNKYELCFSVARMAERFGVSDSSFRRFLEKLQKNGLIKKYKRKVCLSVLSTGRTGSEESKHQFYTSVTFYGWVFAEDDSDPDNEKNTKEESMPGELPPDEHKTDIINTKEEVVVNKARKANFQEYKNPTILFSENPVMTEAIPEKSRTYFQQLYECNSNDLENWFNRFILRQEAEGMEFLKQKELLRRFAYFLKSEFNTKNNNYQKSNNNGKSQSIQPEIKREKSDYEKRREADDAAIIARMPRFGGSGSGCDAHRKRVRRYGSQNVK